MLFINNKKKVLIIDDDRTLLRQVSFHLKKHRGFDIVISDNGKDGLLKAAKQRPDLIILDWTLPDIQGIDLLSRLKKTQKTKNIPVLMFTGHNKIGDVEDAFARGADAYMFKPFSLQKLDEKSKGLMK
ncbi:response regulator [Psychromonas aquimarina]|uniref:response regulator n=1 Tax=Psychromonas aquimarina TaxID=444919 RepID=UPI000414FD6B|nr:response regulator [Psychromonas aquimarina]